MDSEVSGSGPRPFDAGYTPACFLYSLEIDRPFENWLVLGRTGGEFAEIRLADLGLDPAKEYLRLRVLVASACSGASRAPSLPGPLDPKFRSQAFVIRERKPASPGHRHEPARHRRRRRTSTSVRWDGAALAGKSRGVAGDPYILYLTEPDGYAFDKAEAEGAKVEKTEREGRIIKATLAPASAASFAWTARFKAR